MVDRLWIKVCGVTRPADARLVLESGADAIGLNFYRESPRYVRPERAREILDEVPENIEPVGVFVQTEMRDMIDFAGRLPGISTIQSHGAHRPDDPSPYRYIPAFQVQDRSSLQRISDYLTLCRERGQLPRAILVDGSVPGRFGGTGHIAPWDLLADFKPGVPLILAGGLNAENVAEAVRLVRPFGIDVASGVEQSPGTKDPEKIRRFIANAREAGSKVTTSPPNPLPARERV